MKKRFEYKTVIIEPKGFWGPNMNLQILIKP
ncbi:Uncharacterised protein [Chryseobacterium taihuense]|uniref:Uncharacterized protein n=1 Tax=Chryseobacterium taihuense TaxID=1141221 RepID=A0A4U8WFG1_9FLAO|nr:Uncharacterised protein [Chryseobacterium taihuense]